MPLTASEAGTYRLWTAPEATMNQGRNPQSITYGGGRS